MKFPNHLILDIKRNTAAYSAYYWIYTFLLNIKNNIFFFNVLPFCDRFNLKKEKFLNQKFLNQKKFTIKHNLTNLAFFLSNFEKEFYKKIGEPRLKIINKNDNSKLPHKQIYYYLTNKNDLDTAHVNRITIRAKIESKLTIFKSANLWMLFDINFLKKEKIYTKLKYSRTPQYDIVSGGVAAIFSGFLGFLICEKFGFELLDSADFYFLFMYFVFFFFSTRMFIKFLSDERDSWYILSHKWLYNFYKSFYMFLIKNFKINLII